MDIQQQPVAAVQKAHWGWFVACWFMTITVAASISFAVLFIASWNSFDSPENGTDRLAFLLVGAVVVIFALVGFLMHRGLRHDASWPKYLIAIAALSYPARALYYLLLLFIRMAFPELYS